MSDYPWPRVAFRGFEVDGVKPHQALVLPGSVLETSEHTLRTISRRRLDGAERYRETFFSEVQLFGKPSPDPCANLETEGGGLRGYYLIEIGHIKVLESAPCVFPFKL